MSTPEAANPARFVVDESHTIAPSASSSRLLETAIRTSAKTSTVNHLADDERPWADHLSPAERERLIAYAGAHPEKVPAHLAAHFHATGILTRPSSPRSTPSSRTETTQQDQS